MRTRRWRGRQASNAASNKVSDIGHMQAPLPTAPVRAKLFQRRRRFSLKKASCVLFHCVPLCCVLPCVSLVSVPSFCDFSVCGLEASGRQTDCNHSFNLEPCNACPPKPQQVLKQRWCKPALSEAQWCMTHAGTAVDLASSCVHVLLSPLLFNLVLSLSPCSVASACPDDTKMMRCNTPTSPGYLHDVARPFA